MLLIVVEHAHGAPRKSAFELIALGREFATASGQRLAALVLGAEPDAVAVEVARFVPEVYAVRDARLEPLRAEPWTRAVTHVAQALAAEVVLVPASRAGLSYAPRVALRLGAAYLEDVADLGFEGETMVAQRLRYLARVSTSVAAAPGAVVASVKPGASPVAQAAATAGQVRWLEVPFEPVDERLEVVESQRSARGLVALEEADVIVCGGRGLGSSEAFEEHVVGLATRLGAAVGATRAVVDAGWRPYGEQIGQTGKTVAPTLYLALAVSGAVQHLSGMNRSGVVVAVNKDADAPIFKVADYGIVGDVREVVPALIEALADPG